MKIESGKYYRTRDGRKVGPMKYIGGRWPWSCDGLSYTKNGVWHVNLTQSYRDIIAEWQDDSDDDQFAALAAQHGIKITVMIGDAVISYDGRE